VNLVKVFIAPMLVLFLIVVSIQVLSARKTMAAKDALFKACVDQGMDVTWTSETHFFIFTDVKVDCVKP